MSVGPICHHQSEKLHKFVYRRIPTFILEHNHIWGDLRCTLRCIFMSHKSRMVDRHSHGLVGWLELNEGVKVAYRGPPRFSDADTPSNDDEYML